MAGFYQVFTLLDPDIATEFESLRDEIDAGHKELELSRDRKASEQERRAIQLRRIDNCLQIFTQARATFDEISTAFQAQMSLYSSDNSDSISSDSS
jgi:hypothetical protein